MDDRTLLWQNLLRFFISPSNIHLTIVARHSSSVDNAVHQVRASSSASTEDGCAAKLLGNALQELAMLIRNY